MPPVPADLPEDWATHTSVTRPVYDYVNWEYESTIGIGSRSAKFDFRVYPFAEGTEHGAETGYDGVWSYTFSYKIVDISGAGRGFNATPKPDANDLMRDLLGLSYMTSNPDGTEDAPVLPKKEAAVYSGVTHAPFISAVSVKPEKEGSPDVWIMTFKAEKYKYSKVTPKPTSTESPPSMRDPYPWERMPKVSASFGTEEFNIGSGYFLGNKTPTQLGTMITNNAGELAEAFVPGVNSKYEIMKNSAGDPFKSPPKTKTAINMFEINVAYPSNYSGTPSFNTLAGYARAARENINSDTFDIVVGGAVPYIIGKGTAMLSGYAITPADYVDKRDWLPKQWHPFGKTNSELGWTGIGDDYPSASVAVNRFNKTLQATRTLAYINLKLTFVMREVGWGSAIPDRGYRSLDTGAIGPIQEKKSTSATERLLNGSGLVVSDETDTSEVPCFRLYCPFGANTSLASLIDALPWDDRTEV
jgi:hypothetical protein